MARTIRTEILIQAPSDAVWATLVDFAAHDEWDPFLVLEGEPAVGRRLTVKFRQGTTIQPTVTESAPGRVLEWKGKLLFDALFTGRHRFELVPERGGGTRLVHSEQFSGILVPFLKGTLAETERGFGAFNAALKGRVERAA